MHPEELVEHGRQGPWWNVENYRNEISSALAFAKQGASGLILHYFGDEATSEEILTLKSEVEERGARTALIPGDIALLETSKKVSKNYSQFLLNSPATCAKIVEIGVKKFGRIDVLVSNVGICPFSDFLTMPIETWERTRQVNLDGTFYIVQGQSLIKIGHIKLIQKPTSAVAIQMEKQVPQGGSLIAISSISGLLGGAQQWYGFPSRKVSCTMTFEFISPPSHYGPTKAAITNLMQNCAVALGKYGIRANAILPGTIATDINKEDLKDTAKRDYMINRTLLGRLGSKCDLLTST